LTEARGVAVCAGAPCAQRYELAGPQALRIGLHGPRVLSDAGGDLLAAVAYAPPRTGATFARVEGGERVLDVDRDPRPVLAGEGGAAVLLDTRVLAGCFAPGFAGFERMAVERAAGRFALTSEPPESPDGPRRWFLEADGRERREALVWRVGGYVSLWVRLRWREVEDPRLAAGLGLDPPNARITLTPSTGEPFEVWVSAPDAARRVHLWNRQTGVLCSVESDYLPLLVPAEADFTRTEGGNPWERWLAPR
jgi:hypothetical protein